MSISVKATPGNLISTHITSNYNSINLDGFDRAMCLSYSRLVTLRKYTDSVITTAVGSVLSLCIVSLKKESMMIAQHVDSQSINSIEELSCGK